MAEAWLNYLHDEQFEAISAGIEPGVLNPLVVKSMAEEGIDISNNKTQSISEVITTVMNIAYLITVCDETSAERCPSVPGAGVRLHWSFPDPSKLPGSDEEKLEKIGEIRDKIKEKIQKWAGSS